MSPRYRDTITRDLFEVPQPAAPVPAGLDYRATISALVGQMLKEADGDRYEIASRMSRLTGMEVSKYMLDAYSSEARDTYNLPLWLLPALEEACQSHQLTNWLTGVRGGRLLIGREALNAELGKMEKLKEELQRKIREIKRVMGDDHE
jgi:hypothetical protein